MREAIRYKACCVTGLMLLWISAISFTVPAPALGARISGKEGVTPVSPSQPPAKASKQSASGNLKKEDANKTAETSPADDPDERYVTIDFDNVDIRVFIKFISELTGKNFVIDKAVRGKVTVVSPTKISIQEAYRVFESVLEVHGFTTVPAGSITKVVPAVDARTKDIKTLLRRQAVSPEDRVVTQVISLEYADPRELQKLLRPLVSKSSVIVPYAPTGMLVVTDVLSNIQRLLQIIEAIDVQGVGAEISIFPLQYAAAAEMAKSLNTLFQRRVSRGQEGAPGQAAIQIVPDERTNSLITLASEDDTRRIKELIDLLDKKTPRGEGDIRVYYLQNANAEDLAKVLSSIPSEATQTEAKGKAPVVSKEVQIVPDKSTNSLVITASKSDYLVLEDVIQKLDIPRQMVYIEALIMEVSVDKSFNLGVQWQAAEEIGSHEGRDVVGFGQSLPSDRILNKIGTGFSIGVLGEAITVGDLTFPNIGAVIRAIETETGVHILSTPQIMTTDNEEAEIVVADNIPFLVSQERTESDLDYSTYEFRDVGVTLNITPQINQERFVRLKISQEVSQVVSQEEIGLPTTLKRSAETTVIVKDENTLVIGGLIDETLTRSEYKVPCLGNIPGAGWLFKSRSKSGDKTNLYIFLTPHIVRSPAESSAIYEEKRKEMDEIKEGTIKMYDKPWAENPESEPSEENRP